MLPPRHLMLLLANFNVKYNLAFVAGMPMSTRCDPNLITFQPPSNNLWGGWGKDYESFKRKPRRCKMCCNRSDCKGAKAGRLLTGVKRSCQYLQSISAVHILIFEYLDIHRSNASIQAGFVDKLMKKILHIWKRMGIRSKS